MDQTIDIFVSNLNKDVSKKILENFLSSAGTVLKVKFLDDKKCQDNQLAFVGFGTIDEALEAVRIANKSTAFGPPLNAVISRKSMENMDNSRSPMSKHEVRRDDRYGSGSESERYSNVGRGRGIRRGNSPNPPSFSVEPVILNEFKLEKNELMDVEIIDLPSIKTLFARCIKQTENIKLEINQILNEINSSTHTLKPVNRPKVGECYLAKWDDECYYRAELLEILNDSSFKVTFVDEGTSNDIVHDLKHIPDGLLQKYFKQFIKVSLGVIEENKNLTEFIVTQSANKSPKLYWLGAYKDGVPLVNLFLDDMEVIEHFEKVHGSQLRGRISHTMHDLPSYNLKKYADVVLNEDLYKSPEEFVVKINHKVNCDLIDRKRPQLLPLRNDICIYEDKTSIRAIPTRCFIKKRSGLLFDIELIDTCENLSNISIDDLFTANQEHINHFANSIHCQLDNNEDFNDKNLINTLKSSNFSFELNRHLQHNKYLVIVKPISQSSKILKYSDFDLTSLIGNSYQVFITHSVSPINFYVQINKKDLVLTLTDIHQKINSNYPGSPIRSIKNLHIGQAVIAPFSLNSDEVGDNFRATVVDKREELNQVKLFYVDYGNEAWVNVNKLLDVDDALVSQPSLCIHCSLNVLINKEAWGHSIDMFHNLIGFPDGEECELAMEVLREVDSKLIVELTSQVRGVVSGVLINKGVCSAIRSNRNTPQKPMCNGDSNGSNSFFVKKTNNPPIKSFKPNNAIDCPRANLFNSPVKQDNSLLRKVEELEARVSQLEALIFN